MTADECFRYAGFTDFGDGDEQWEVHAGELLSRLLLEVAFFNGLLTTIIRTCFNAIPEAEKFAGFLSVSEGIPWLISKRDLEFSHDFTPTQLSTLSSGVSAVLQSHRNPGKYA